MVARVAASDDLAGDGVGEVDERRCLVVPGQVDGDDLMVERDQPFAHRMPEPAVGTRARDQHERRHDVDDCRAEANSSRFGREHRTRRATRDRDSVERRGSPGPRSSFGEQ